MSPPLLDRHGGKSRLATTVLVPPPETIERLWYHASALSLFEFEKAAKHG